MRSDWDARAQDNWVKAIVGRDMPADQFWESGPRLLENSLRTLADLGIDPKREFAVDFGCGAGRITHPLASQFERVAGFDVSPAMAELAKNNLKDRPNTTIEVIDGDSIPLPDASTDFVWSWAVFQHLPSNGLMEQMLDEVCRILKPGGVLFVEVPTLTGIYKIKGIPVFPRRLRDQVPAFIRRVYLRANHVREDRAKPTWRGGASMAPRRIEQRLRDAGVTPRLLRHEMPFKRIAIGTKD